MADTNVTPVAVPVEEVEGANAKTINNYELTTQISNISRSRVHMVETHFWHGHALTNFPPLPVNTYAEPRQAGALPQGPVDWNVVEVKLDQHSGSRIEYADPILGGKIVAFIDGTFAQTKFYN